MFKFLRANGSLNIFQFDLLTVSNSPWVCPSRAPDFTGLLTQWVMFYCYHDAVRVTLVPGAERFRSATVTPGYEIDMPGTWSRLSALCSYYVMSVASAIA